MLDAHARLLMVTCAYVTADLEHSTLAPLAGGHAGKTCGFKCCSPVACQVANVPSPFCRVGAAVRLHPSMRKFKAASLGMRAAMAGSTRCWRRPRTSACTC